MTYNCNQLHKGAQRPQYSLWRMVNRKRSGSGGFTLIELLVVIGIIVFILGIAAVSYRSANKRSRDSRRKADLEQIRSALEMYRADNGAYPTDAQGINILVSSNYLNTTPSDPLTYTYFYDQLSSASYRLCSYLELGGPNNCGNNCGAPGDCNYQVQQP